jgi:predicted nuclease with TOPRIM domain
MFKKLDIKSIFIIVLSVLLLLSIWFRPSKTVDNHKNEIDQLIKENERLLSTNDSLKLSNIIINREVDKLHKEIDDTQERLRKTNNKIKDLEDGKDKVSDYVKSLDADGISKSLTEYLNNKTK